MVTPRDQARIRRAVWRAAAGALSGPRTDVAMSGRRRGAIGVGAAVAVVSLTVAAAFGIFGGHPAAARAVTAQPSVSVPPVPSSPTPPAPVPSPDPSASASPSAWQNSGVLIIDATTGTRYVFRSGKLRPVRNTVSAHLILGSSTPRTVTVAHATIASAVTGAPIGISGTLPVMPAASAILPGGWVVCSGPVSGSGTPVERIVASTVGTLSANGLVGYGSGLTGGTGLGDHALVVVSGGTDYLILDHRRDLLTDPDQVFKAWKWTDVTPLPVAADVLDTLPAGAPITPTALGAKPIRADLARSSTLCVTLTAAGAVEHTVVSAVVGTGVGRAGLVISAHHGALVHVTAGLYLVTDRGIRYHIASASALVSLGYASAPTVSVPTSVLDRLPAGTTLSRTAAIDG
jgi:hypothetical protein